MTDITPCYHDVTGLCKLCNELSTNGRAGVVTFPPDGWQLASRTLCAHDGILRAETHRHYGPNYGRVTSVAMGELKERYFLIICAVLAFLRIATEIGLPREDWPHNIDLSYIIGGTACMSALHAVCGAFVHNAFAALRIIAATGALSLFHADPLSWTTRHFGVSVPALFFLLGPNSMGILVKHARLPRADSAWVNAVVNFDIGLYEQMEQHHAIAKQLSAGQTPPKVCFEMHDRRNPTMYQLLVATQFTALNFTTLDFVTAWEEPKVQAARGALNLWTWLVVHASKQFLTDVQVLYSHSTGTRGMETYFFHGLDTKKLVEAALPVEDLGPRLAESMARFLAEANMGDFYAIGSADFVGSTLRNPPPPVSDLLTCESPAIFRSKDPYICIFHGIQFPPFS